MNVPVQWSEVAIAAAAGFGSQGTLDPERAADVCAVWTAVFEGERAMEPSQDESRREASATDSVGIAMPAAPPMLKLVVASDRAEPVARAVAPQATDTTPQSGAAEWINVFVHGAAVAVVVRNTSLSAKDALHCAFETARELTGQRGALQELTLNGKTIYRQPANAGRERAAMFAC
jgi:hypothetical protein